MKEPDARYSRAGEAAARILNDYFDASRPTGELFLEILFVIKAAMHAAEEDLHISRFTPSDN